MSEQGLPRLTPAPRTGKEPFRAGGKDLGFSLAAFWRWSSSDLVSNTLRGVLAEFIVAKALGLSTDRVRVEWDMCDLTTSSGLRLEVKSAAYLQSWAQSGPSKVSFMVKPRRGWDADTNRSDSEAKRHAHVYVFALLAHQNKTTVDPLNLDQWLFWAVSTKVLDARTRSQHSITLPSLVRLAGEGVSYRQLSGAVSVAGSLHGRTPD
jgi:hypothetical protein